MDVSWLLSYPSPKAMKGSDVQLASQRTISEPHAGMGPPFTHCVLTNPHSNGHERCYHSHETAEHAEAQRGGQAAGGEQRWGLTGLGESKGGALCPVARCASWFYWATYLPTVCQPLG